MHLAPDPRPRAAVARVARRAVCCVASLALAAGAACGGDDSGWGRALGGGGERKRVGVSLPTRATPFYRELEAGMRDAARRVRYELVVTDANMSAPTQVAQVEGFLGQRVDAVVVAPVDSAGILPAVERANTARVPVFTIGLRPAGGRVVSHVQADHETLGRIAADYLATFLNGRGEVGIVSRRGIPALAEREQGFRTALRQRRGITIVDSVEGGGSRDGTAAAVEAMLRARREIDAIFSVDEAGALGAHDAALTRYRADLLIVGADGSSETVQLVTNEGPLKATIVQRPRRMGEQMIQLIVRHFDDEPVAPRVLVPVRLVNVDSVRPAGRQGAQRRR
jgi:ribose transport system substrate-binding protein